jgi:ketosteroid isomerase-like protein
MPQSEEISMGKQFLLAVVFGIATTLVLFTPGLHPSQAKDAEESPRTTILSVLGEQQAAWNRGDVEGFMQGYWNSPQLTFAGSGGITRGWQPVLDRYRRRYPDAQAMGHLDFSQLEVYPLGKDADAALVLGRWHLKRLSDEPGGVFTLVFRRFPEGWRIIHDHTSADEKDR